jgi:hypothetical protein
MSVASGASPMTSRRHALLFGSSRLLFSGSRHSREWETPRTPASGEALGEPDTSPVRPGEDAWEMALEWAAGLAATAL